MNLNNTYLQNWYQKREVAKEPLYPNLSNKDEDILEKIIFREADVLKPVDVLFVFGSRSHMEEQMIFLEDFIKKWLTKNVILSWWIVKYEDRKIYSIPECYDLHEKLCKKWLWDINYSLEDLSTNSYDNVVFTQEKWFFDWYNTIWFVCAEHASRRDYGYLKKVLKDKVLFQYSIPFIYDGNVIDKNNWKNSLESKSRVWWEYLRLCKYWLEFWNFDISDIYSDIKKLERYK